MDLRPKHLPPILIGGLVGAALGWAALLGLSALGIADIQNPLGVRATGCIFGGIAGLALAVITIVVKEARDPGTAPASNFTQMNGMGSTFIGRADRREDGSYITTEWFTIAWIPLFPVCRYRLIEHEQARGLFYREYTILEKSSLSADHVMKVYAFEAIAILILAGAAYLIFT